MLSIQHTLIFSVCALCVAHRSVGLLRIELSIHLLIKVSKGAKIRNRYNQVPQLTHDTKGKVTNSQLDTTNESQEASPFPAGDHKAINRRTTQRHYRHKTEKNTNYPQKKYRLGTVSKNILLEGLNQFHGANLTLDSDFD